MNFFFGVVVVVVVVGLTAYWMKHRVDCLT